MNSGSFVSLFASALLPVSPAITPQTPSAAEKEAIAYISRQSGQALCVAGFRKNAPLTTFQEELATLNKTYTIFYLDSVEHKLAGDEQAQRAFLLTPSHCAHELVFARPTLAGFILCEVVPAGDRVFTHTQAYLFRVKGHHAVFVARKVIAYN